MLSNIIGFILFISIMWLCFDGLFERVEVTKLKK
jgi:hypothetical protein